MVQKRGTKAINKLCVRKMLGLCFVCGAYFFRDWKQGRYACALSFSRVPPHTTPHTLSLSQESCRSLDTRGTSGSLFSLADTNMAAIVRGCRLLERAPFLVSFLL